MSVDAAEVPWLESFILSAAITVERYFSASKLHIEATSVIDITRLVRVATPCFLGEHFPQAQY